VTYRFEHLEPLSEAGLLARQHQSRSSNAMKHLLFQPCPEMVTDPDRLILDNSHRTSGCEGCFFRCTCRAASPSGLDWFVKCYLQKYEDNESATTSSAPAFAVTNVPMQRTGAEYKGRAAAREEGNQHRRQTGHRCRAGSRGAPFGNQRFR
jgi:hypothetical protein